MEAELLFVFLLIGTMFLCPLYDVLNLCYLHVIFIQDCQDILVEKSLIQGIYVGFRSQADSLIASFFGCFYTVLKFALISKCPGTDCNWKFF